MLTLPQSNPLYEQLPVTRVNLPDVLSKMGNGGFTGYLSYSGQQAEAYALFARGVFISILLLDGERRKSGFEAISSLFEAALSGDGALSIYRMTADLVICTHALLHGDPLLLPQEVRTVDLKALLDRLKLQTLNGTVLFRADGHHAMIFYREGLPIGFYHDGAREIETSPTASQRIAAMPGATVEVRSCPPASDLLLHNLLETVNIERLWEAVGKRAAGRVSPAPAAPITPPAPANDQLREVVDDLREIATAYLSRQGGQLIDRLLQDGGGSSLLLDPARTSSFLAATAAALPTLDPEAKVAEIVDLMRSEIAGRLSV